MIVLWLLQSGMIPFGPEWCHTPLPATAALRHLLFLLGVLWLTYWCAAAGRSWGDVCGAVAVAALVLTHAHTRALLSLAPWPNTPPWWTGTAAPWAIGSVSSLRLERTDCDGFRRSLDERA